jgi:hypothetical protein
MGVPRASGGASRTGLVNISPMLSPDPMISPRGRANPREEGFAGRRRNMPSKSTIPASLTPFTKVHNPQAFDSRNMKERNALAQQNTLS